MHAPVLAGRWLGILLHYPHCPPLLSSAAQIQQQQEVRVSQSDLESWWVHAFLMYETPGLLPSACFPFLENKWGHFTYCILLRFFRPIPCLPHSNTPPQRNWSQGNGKKSFTWANAGQNYAKTSDRESQVWIVVERYNLWMNLSPSSAQWLTVWIAAAYRTFPVLDVLIGKMCMRNISRNCRENLRRKTCLPSRALAHRRCLTILVPP